MYCKKSYRAVKFLNEIGLDKFDASDEMLTLALGGSTNGASTLQMAAAYAMIANGGEYITPTYYTKVESAAGRLILQAKQDKKRVMTEGNAYILANILNAPVTGSNGTARICKIPGIETGAKTGTTSDYKDKWLCGITPYYAAATWFGYDEPEQVNIYGMSNPAATLWSEIMKEVHSGLEEAEFEKPNNIVSATICMDSGKVATKQCSRTYKEVFVSGTVPSQCDGHEKVKICKDTKKLATEFCPKTTTKTYVSRPEKEVNPNWSTSEGGKYNEITETCTKHKEEEKEPEEPEETEPTPEETEPKPEETPTIDTPTNNNIVVPNVIGKTETQAKDELREFSIQVVFGKDTTKPNGVVLKQSLSAGQSVVKGAKITLTINDIPVVTEPPEEPTKNEEVPKENTEVEDKNEIT